MVERLKLGEGWSTSGEHIIFKWTRVKSNLWNNLHTSKGCDTKTLQSRTDAYLTILNEIGYIFLHCDS